MSSTSYGAFRFIPLLYFYPVQVEKKNRVLLKVVGSKPGHGIFKEGNLVQVFNTRLDKTTQTKKKLLPRWSGASRITGRVLNSYTVATVAVHQISCETSSEGLSHRQGLHSSDMRRIGK
ncbi:hypothetical protein IW261DRAFT_923004 [Armillaria novae-zelandiae]|uniref:Uncharacterized protein n=1 Tax=Armillaria novae-zelandiae TaxID=153914 RepID=A0AA39NSA3_9AGAR|nr:hypothetical protein IW261DRAFT_923004 [Armillaria novae-zelandiae]